MNWADCVSVAKCGGMAALVAAAKKEGTLNVITLPSNWANYGNIMKDFTAKYGIKIIDANPEGSSQDEINAMSSSRARAARPTSSTWAPRSRSRPDQEGLLAPYKVATWNDIPASAKATRRAPGTPTTAATWPSATTRRR